MSPGDGIVVVGGSLAALRFAESARRVGLTDPITILGDEPHLPYNRPPLSKAALHDGIDIADLAFPLRASIDDVQWRPGVGAVGVDLATGVVATTSGPVPFDTLVAATGLRPRRSLRDPSGARRVHAIRSIDDAARLRDALGPSRHVLVVGGGFLGCEIAATARRRGAHVTLVCADELPLRRPLGPHLATRLRDEHRRHGVDVVSSARVTALVDAPGERLDVELSTGETRRVDLVVEATGSEPATGWLADSGLDASHGILTDGAMRALTPTGDPARVLAIGDVARFPNPRFDDEPRIVGHWNLPAETAKRAATTLAAARAAGVAIDALDVSTLPPFAPLPSFWSDQYDIHLFALGLTSLATGSTVAHGALDGDVVVEYHRGEELVGVAGIGLRSTVMSYRDRIGRATA